MDNFLLKRQARETGICEIRRELYDQTFDELIRQVAISCQERGLLLLRVRDELRMTIDSYKSLYESGTAFGMRKTLSNEDRQLKLEAENKSLLSELQKLKLQNSQLKQDLEESDKKNLERRALDEKKSSEEAMQLKKLNALLKTQLESVMMAAAASAKK